MNSDHWAKYPDSRPPQAGYYVTYYYNAEQDEMLYKALWYSAQQQKFIFRIKDVDQHIKGYVPTSYHQYYVPCITNWSEDKRKMPFPVEMAKENNNENEPHI